MEFPLSAEKTIAVAVLRLIGLSQKTVVGILHTSTDKVVSVEKWLREENYLKVANLCTEKNIKESLSSDAFDWSDVSGEELIKAAKVGQDEILLHYQPSQYTEHSILKNVFPLAQRYLEKHYEDLIKLVSCLHSQIQIPKLEQFDPSKQLGIEISYGCADIPTAIYDKGVFQLAAERDILWQELNEHLVKEISDFKESFDLWKSGIVNLMDASASISKQIEGTIEEHAWPLSEPHIDPTSTEYRAGVFPIILQSLLFHCVVAEFAPKFELISGTRNLDHIVMEFPGGKKEVARGDADLLVSLEQKCLKFSKNQAISVKAEEMQTKVEDVEKIQKSLKDELSVILNRRSFNSMCSVCSPFFK